MSERLTEDIIREHFKNDSLYEQIIIEEQQSENVVIDKLLSGASKSGSGKGHPDFIIRYNNDLDFLIVIECKKDTNYHESDTRKRYKEFAVDGVLLYAGHLSKSFNVIAIAFSGNKDFYKVDHFLCLKNSTGKAPKRILNNTLYSFADYYNRFMEDEDKNTIDFTHLMEYATQLNKDLHNLAIGENQRSLLIAACLIALEDTVFRNSYAKQETSRHLVSDLITATERVLSAKDTSYVHDIIQSFQFIIGETKLKEDNNLRIIIKSIEDNVYSYIKKHSIVDTIGQFYIKFLRYSNHDNGLGIILTPPHVTELFCEIGNVNKSSVVYDNCTGTGGFLISAMKKMIHDANYDSETIQKIKKSQILGVELSNQIFTLLCANMYLHEDGRSCLFKGDSFNIEIQSIIKKFNPNIGMLNPPYKSDKKSSREELEFVLKNLEVLQKGSLCIAIIPMGCVVSTKKNSNLELRKYLLENHTLEASFSMPPTLFKNSDVAIVTNIIVLRAQEKHPAGYKSYFADWKNDGFSWIRGRGRDDHSNNWDTIKAGWLYNYKNRIEVKGHSVMQEVAYNDEWCVENYLHIDYSKELSKAKFIEHIKNYVVFLF